MTLAEQAKRRAQEMVTLTDRQLADVYVETLREPKNLHFNPYFVGAVRDVGLWERLDTELTRRQAA